jgi:hypothetical protein
LAISGGSVQLLDSTVSENSAGVGGAIYIAATASPSTISNSTVSGNNATFANAVAVYAPLTLQNSTVAKNYAALEFGGLYIGGTSLTLQSSILANNTAGASSTPSDLQVSTLGASSVAGGYNLVMMATGLPLPAGIVTVTQDPMLSPLQFNGGRTKSHALLAGSPAIGGGNNQALLTTDQRGSGFPRSTGAASTTDIGAIEFDSIFAHGFEY